MKTESKIWFTPGAMSAAYELLIKSGFVALSGTGPINLNPFAEIISQKTHDVEMLELLRLSLSTIIEELAAAGPEEVRSHPTLKRHSETAAKIELLLSRIGGQS